MICPTHLWYRRWAERTVVIHIATHMNRVRIYLRSATETNCNANKVATRWPLRRTALRPVALWRVGLFYKLAFDELYFDRLREKCRRVGFYYECPPTSLLSMSWPRPSRRHSSFLDITVLKYAPYYFCFIWNAAFGCYFFWTMVRSMTKRTDD